MKSVPCWVKVAWDRSSAARDTRLQRDVAIKVLPQSFSRDADRLRRFEQESRAVAALNHANLLIVFDSGTMPLPGGSADETVPLPGF